MILTRLWKRIPRPVRVVIVLAHQVVLIVLVVAVTMLVIWANNSRKMADPDPWHIEAPESEVDAKSIARMKNFDEYLRAEEAIFKEVEEVYLGMDSGRSPFLRYVEGGKASPIVDGVNWNRSQILEPQEIKGGVLLLHGLTDSPYSMRSMAMALRDRGYYALCLRLPGHGTTPAALKGATWKDWAAAVELASAHVRSKIGPEMPWFICGYSTGGALAVVHSLENQGKAGWRAPSGLVLMSPLIGLTSMARASDLYLLLNWVPAFEKFEWLAIEPEFDPFKYVSFPKHAGGQSWKLVVELRRVLTAHAQPDGTVPGLPPILAFQSVVDDTVVARELTDNLMPRVTNDSSEVVFFNINGLLFLNDFMRHSDSPQIDSLMAAQSLPYTVRVIQNAESESQRLAEFVRARGSSEISRRDLGLEWPLGVYSLSHVAIPFSAADPVYGTKPESGRTALGALALRGERRVLRISADVMLRLRFNPFHEYMMQRMTEWVDARSGMEFNANESPPDAQ